MSTTPGSICTGKATRMLMFSSPYSLQQRQVIGSRYLHLLRIAAMREFAPSSLGLRRAAAAAPAPAAMGGGRAASAGTATLHCHTCPESVTIMSSISSLHSWQPSCSLQTSGQWPCSSASHSCGEQWRWHTLCTCPRHRDELQLVRPLSQRPSLAGRWSRCQPQAGGLPGTGRSHRLRVRGSQLCQAPHALAASAA